MLANGVPTPRKGFAIGKDAPTSNAAPFTGDAGLKTALAKRHAQSLGMISRGSAVNVSTFSQRACLSQQYNYSPVYITLT
jgi:hypothetical protein